MSRPSPIIQSLVENPSWIKRWCARCTVPFWALPSKADVLKFCCKACRCLPPRQRILDRVTKVSRHGGHPADKPWDRGDCWICCLSVNSWGYAHVKVNGKLVRAHRWMWEYMNGPITGGLYALHYCIDSKNCVNPDHIHPGTQADNLRECLEQGRHKSPKGEDCHWSILTLPQVIEIKKYATLENRHLFADKFGVSSHAVYQVLAGINWKWVIV